MSESNLIEQKRKANELRKAGNFKEALPLYRNLWKETEDKFDGAGLLHCLRKLDLFGEAIPLADTLYDKFPDFSWCRNEVIWTYIEGVLCKLDENECPEKVIQIAERIMSFKPDALAAKVVVFKVLKTAKEANDWEIVNEWVVKVDPDSLSMNPMIDDSGREGWSDQGLWYNFRIRGLIEKGERKQAISILDGISGRFPRQEKFFLRLKALANHLLGNLDEAEKIYEDLYRSHRADWWILCEYARVIRDAGRKEVALRIMYEAAIGHSKLESMVSLFADIGMICKDLGKNEVARNHLSLCKHVRNEKHWLIPPSVSDAIDDLNKVIGNSKEPVSLKEALYACRVEWIKVLGLRKDLQTSTPSARKARKGLFGKVSMGKSEQPFCFIITNERESVFCWKSDLPSETKDSDEVNFDAIPSFDKKKNKESWKASNVRRNPR
jgi:tetratricopeptide (TPR) repeat protein